MPDDRPDSELTFRELLDKYTWPVAEGPLHDEEEE